MADDDIDPRDSRFLVSPQRNTAVAPDPNADPRYPPSSSPTLMNQSWSKFGSDLWDSGGRGLGLGTREVAEGATGLPTAIADVMTWPARTALRAFGAKVTAPSDIVQKGLDLTGLPNPQTDAEKLRAEAVRGGAAMLTPMGLGAAFPRLAAEAPAVFSPATSVPRATSQVAQGAGGGALGEELASSEIVPEWLKPTVRLAGNVVGGASTAKLSDAVEKITNAARGIQNPIAAAFERLGITPRSVGDVTTSPTSQGTQAAITRLPLASGVLQPAGQQVVDDFGRAVETTASNFSQTATNAQRAGEQMQAEARNWRDNVWPQQQAAVWTPLNQRMAGSSVTPAGYRTALDDLTTQLSLPETSRVLTPATVRQLREALVADVPPGGTMTWEQAQQLRTKLGQALGVPDIVQSVGKDALTRAYGGIARDMESTATAHGQGQVFANANQVSRDGHAFIESTLSKIIRSNNPAQDIHPEDATKNILNAGDTDLAALRDRIPGAADAAAAWKLRQMAYAKPSQQDATGVNTSTGTFLSNLSRERQTQPGGLTALYDTPAAQQNLGDLATVAANLRATERGLNTSNTGTATAVAALPASMAAGFYAGGVPGAVAGPVLQLGSPWALAKWMTSPMAVRLAAAQRAQRPTSGLLGGAASNLASPQ